MFLVTVVLFSAMETDDQCTVQSLGGETPPTTKIVSYSFNVSSQNDIPERSLYVQLVVFQCIFSFVVRKVRVTAT